MTQEVKSPSLTIETTSCRKSICPPSFKSKTVRDLDYSDVFFDSLKEKYDDFYDWFHSTSTQSRNCWVHNKDSKIGALLIYKTENEIVESKPPLPKKYRLKICTFKVAESTTGNKIGELLLKYAIKLAIKENVYEIYLTHFTESNDMLISLIEEYGFCLKAKKDNGEDVYVKKCIAEKDDFNDLSAIEIAKNFYPSFYDGEDINKFIVPIIPRHHKNIFNDAPDGKQHQIRLYEIFGDDVFEGGDFTIEGNAIKKAYLCNSNSKKMKSGDILLFYRSGDLKSITALGVIESIHFNLKDADQIYELVKKRTVFSKKEIQEIASKPTMVILFMHQIYFKNAIKLNDLRSLDIRSTQSITQIDNEKYITIKEIGGVDERFTIN